MCRKIDWEGQIGRRLRFRHFHGREPRQLRRCSLDLLSLSLSAHDPNRPKPPSFDPWDCARVKREPTLGIAQVRYLARWPEDRRPRGQAVSCLVLFAATEQMDYRRRTKSA
jgi:hypothetical protein